MSSPRDHGTAALQFTPTLPPEEAARANFYALLARLFYAPPDQPLLDLLAGAGEMAADDTAVSQAWDALVRAASVVQADEVKEEYDNAFVGTGKAPISLYTCAYTIQ